jgi:replicative DNA helicase
MAFEALLDKRPHNSEAERTVLGALLIDPEAIFKVDALLRPVEIGV